MSGEVVNGDGAVPDMDPNERKVWCASHALPPQYLLVTRSEMHLMGDAMAQQRALATALSRTFKRCEKILKEYWDTEPDQPNAVAAAVFDAHRYKKAVDLVLPALRAQKENLDAAVRLCGMLAPTVLDDLNTISKELGEKIKLLDKQIALRRDRKETP